MRVDLIPEESSSSGDAFSDSILALSDSDTSNTTFRCVKIKIVAVSLDIATCSTNEGETLLLPISEYFIGDSWSIGEELNAVRYSENGGVWLSTTRPELVSLLAEGIIPELRQGQIRIMGIARIPGVRTKIAVASTKSLNPDADPVAVMVGKSANRIRFLSQLLANERLDIVAWSPNPEVYLKNALAPAKVLQVQLTSPDPQALGPDNKTSYEVTVAQHLMAAAVGHHGLNTKLASILLNADVVVKSNISVS